MTKFFVDPGNSSGAIAVQKSDPNPKVYNMPETAKDMYEFFKELRTDDNLVIMENVGGSRPGNSAKSARTFALHLGHLELICIALELPVIKVTPAKWMNAVAPGRPKGDKAANKTYIYDAMQRRFPHIKFTKRQADAVGIYAWWLETGK